ncbi:MAG: hypothetical protein AAF518_03790 [Spirochaetota bacterium]
MNSDSKLQQDFKDTILDQIVEKRETQIVVSKVLSIKSGIKAGIKPR